MAQPAFHRKTVGDFVDIIIAANSSLIKKWEQAARQKDSVNVTHDVSKMILEIVLKTIFGDDFDQVGSQFNMVSEVSARNLEFAQTFRSLGKVIHQVVAHRRASDSNRSDILGMLMSARDQETLKGMSDSQLVNEALTLIVAGHETTASTLNWGWYLISQDPEVEAKLSKEVDTLLSSEAPAFNDLSKFTYAQKIIDETLRLYPAGWLMTRKALKDDQFGEYFVPAGTEIYISPYFIQRHPGLWKDADHFNPDRFDPDDSEERRRLMQLPFSAGPRNCIGEYFARVEMQMHLIMIAKRLRLQYVQTKPLELEAGVNLRSKYDFVMTPELKSDAGR